MASLYEITKEWADELRDGIAWLVVWKTRRSWNAMAFWLDFDTDTFKGDDVPEVRKILSQDPNAVMLNGYDCGRFEENMTIKELSNGILWHYQNKSFQVKNFIDSEI